MFKRTLFFMMGLILLISLGHAGGPGTTNANFLKAGQGVRAVAMGETYVALGDDLDTLYWNPAGLSQLKTVQAAFTHSFWMEEIGTEYLAFGTPLGPLGAIGGGITLMNAGTITQTLEDSSGNYVGTAGDVSAMSLAFIGTYAQKLNRLIPSDDPFVKNTLVGASLRVVSESVAEASIFGGGLDIGALWRQTEEIKPREVTTLNALRQKASDVAPTIRDAGWRIGFVAQNLGVTTDQMMPINFRLGGGYIINDALTDNGRFTFAADALIPVDNNFKISLGTEYALVGPSSKVAARVGYKIGNEIQDLDSMAGLTAGAGFAILISGIRYQLDYAFVPYGDLGTTQRISLTLEFLTGKNAVTPLAAQVPVPSAMPSVVPMSKPQARKEAKTPPQADKKTDQQVKSTEKKEPPKTEPAKENKAPQVEATPAPTKEPEVDKGEESKKLRSALNRIMGSIKAGMLPGINFDRGTAALTKTAQRGLGQIGKQLERYDYGKVVIVGFAGAKKDLAEARAKAVERYLKMSFRFDANRLETKVGEAGKETKNSSIDIEVVLEK